MDEGNSNQILIAVTQLQTQMGTVSEQLKEISKIGQTVVEVVESSKQAHRRLDDIKAEVDKDLEKQRKDFEKELAAQKEDYCAKIAAETKAREEDVKNLDKSVEKDLDNQKEAFKEFYSDIKFLKRSVYGGFISVTGGLVIWGIQWLANN